MKVRGMPCKVISYEDITLRPEKVLKEIAQAAEWEGSGYYTNANGESDESDGG